MKKFLGYKEDVFQRCVIYVFLILFAALPSMAQDGPRYFGLSYQQANPNMQTLTIIESYGYTLNEHLEGSQFLENTPWRILDQKNRRLLQQGIGASLVEVSFDQPGKFLIELDIASTHDLHDNTCFHPDIPDVIDLTILSSKISYDLESVSLSGAIRGGVELTGIILSVQIKVESLHDSLISIPEDIVGVGVENQLKGQLLESFQRVSKGEHVIQYALIGTVKVGTYIGIQFEDLAGKHSIYLVDKPVD